MRRGSVDPAYCWQLVGHLDCTGRNWVDFISYCSEFPEETQLLVYRLYRADYETAIQLLRERRKLFLTLVDEIQQTIKG